VRAGDLWHLGGKGGLVLFVQQHWMPVVTGDELADMEMPPCRDGLQGQAKEQVIGEAMLEIRARKKAQALLDAQDGN
jgi:hypothetical protein